MSQSVVEEMRRDLLKRSRVDVKKRCVSLKLSSEGSKIDMIDRIIEHISPPPQDHTAYFMQRIKHLKATLPPKPLVSPVPRRSSVTRQTPSTSNTREDADNDDDDDNDEVEERKIRLTVETFFPFYFTYLQRTSQCSIPPEIQRLITLFCIYSDDAFLVRVGRIDGVVGVKHLALRGCFVRDLICHSEGTLVLENVLQRMFIMGVYYGCYAHPTQTHLHGFIRSRPLPLSPHIQLFFHERCGHAINATFVAENRLVQCEHNAHTVASQNHTGHGFIRRETCYRPSKNYMERLESPLINVQHIEKIHCGVNHALILMRDGSVFGVGANQYYQCGVPHHQNFIRSPARVELMDGDVDDIAKLRIIDIVVGDNFNFLIDDRHRLWIFGFSSYYAMGIDVKWCKRPILHPNVYANVKVRKVDCAVGHALVTVDDGDCYAFGYGFQQIFKNLHMGILSCVYDTDEQSSRIVDIACGRLHSLMLTQQNEVFAIGSNRYRQCSKRSNVGNQDHVIETPLKLRYKEDLGIKEHLRIVQVFASKYESIFVVQ